MAGVRAKLYRIPLLPVAAAMIVGIIGGRFVPAPPGLWAAVAAVGVLAAAVAFRKRHLHLLASSAIGAAILALSAAHVQLAYFTVPNDHIVTYTAAGRTLATLRGRILTQPQVVAPMRQQEFSYYRPSRTVFLLEASGLGVGEKARPACGLVRVTIEEPAGGLSAGQKVELIGWIGRFSPPSNPGQYDSAAAARRRGALVWCSVPCADGARVFGGQDDAWHVRALRRVRAAAHGHFVGADAGDYGRVVQAIIVGQRHPSLKKLNEAMARAGVAHYLSISGMHLGVFLGFVYLLCRLVTFSRRRSAAIVLCVVVAYVLLAEVRAPLLRAAMMAGALCVAAMARRQYSGLNALAAAAIVLLLIDPLQLLSAGFQLSFAIVAGLILLQAPLRELLFGRWLARRGLVVFRSDRRLARWLSYTARNWLIGGVTMGLAAWGVSAPLAAWHFGLFSPYGMPLTLLLLLPVAAVLIPGYVSLALAWPMPNLSDAFARLAEGGAWLLVRIVDGLRFLPGLSLPVRPVGPIWVALCYLAMGLWAARRRVPFGTAAAVACTAALAGLTIHSQLPAAAPRGMELDLLAVGSGQCALVRVPDGRTWLFDAGTRSTLDVHEQVLGPFLRNRRLPAPQEAFVSHANTDHYSGLAEMVRSGTIRRVYLNEYFGGGFAGEAHDPADELRFAELLERHGVEIVRLAAGDVVPLDERTRVEVLWPPRGAPAQENINDTSLVLRVVCDGKSILFTGDIQAGPQEALAKGAEGLRADVLVMPHHGSWSEALAEFVGAVRPSVLAVSRSGKPRAPAAGSDAAGDFYARLRSDGRYHSTARDGWIQVRLGRGEIEVRSMR